MFTIFIYDSNRHNWEQEGVYDCESFDPSWFKDFDEQYSWYARPDDEEGEEFLHAHGII